MFRRSYLCHYLPTILVSVVCGPAQKVYTTISKKIEDLVREGAVDPNDIIKRSLKEYVKNHFSEFSKPTVTDCTY